MDKFLLYNTDLAIIDELSNEEAGILFKTICCYTKHGIEPTDKNTRIHFATIKAHLDEDSQKQVVLKQKKSEAGKQGGRPSKLPKIKPPTKPLALPVEQYEFVNEFLDQTNPQVAYQMANNANYLDTQCREVDKLIKDGYDLQTIQTVLRFIKQDSFWSKNILSIAKLRKKDKEGVPYIIKMVNQVRQYKPRVVDLDSMQL